MFGVRDAYCRYCTEEIDLTQGSVYLLCVWVWCIFGQENIHLHPDHVDDTCSSPRIFKILYLTFKFLYVTAQSSPLAYCIT